MLLQKMLVAVVALLAISVGLAAQSPNSPRVALPNSIALTDIQIGLLRKTSGGCQGRCVHYRVTIQGDGTVKYEDLADPPVPPRERKIAVGDVVALMNEFIAAHYFEASARYVGRHFYVLQGERLSLMGRAADDGPEWDLSLRLGGLEKSVHLYLDYPDHLGSLRDRVDQVGGPQSWTTR